MKNLLQQHQSEVQKRECRRFSIVGATATVFRQRWGCVWRPFVTYGLPVFDISRGGLRLLSQHRLPEGAALRMTVSVPEDDAPLDLRGQVVWCGHHVGRSYRYEIGIQFLPYGAGKRMNAPEALERIIVWEESSRNAEQIVSDLSVAE